MSHTDDLLWGAIANLSRFSALYTMAELGVADHLAQGPLGTGELAERCAADATALRRVLREVASMGLVKSLESDRFDLSELGNALRDDVPGSIRSSIRMLGEEGFWYAMGNLPATVRNGSSAFVERYGPIYRHLAANPDTARMFDEYMTGRAIPFAESLAKRYDFAGVGTLVDVAGGKGHILATVMHAHPQLRGVLFDLEHVTERAGELLAAEGLADRSEVVSGDFFQAVPAGADAYLLGSVLHNWDDADAVKILGNVRAAMNPGGRVLLLEVVLPDDDAPHHGKDIDMRMLAIFNGGLERSREEYSALLAQAGLTLTQVVELATGASLIEATAAS